MFETVTNGRTAGIEGQRSSILSIFLFILMGGGGVGSQIFVFLVTIVCCGIIEVFFFMIFNLNGNPFRFT
jgi:hypothetical protein